MFLLAIGNERVELKEEKEKKKIRLVSSDTLIQCTVDGERKHFWTIYNIIV